MLWTEHLPAGNLLSTATNPLKRNARLQFALAVDLVLGTKR
jgi:hypothetical protein